MALIKCVECGADVSDEAAACPKCGKPPKSVPAFVDPAKNKKAFSRLVAILAVGVILLVCFFIYYRFGMSKEQRDAVNAVASNTGIGQSMIPWVDRADTVFRKMCEGDQGRVLAKSILNAIHPTGKDPQLAGMHTEKHNDVLEAHVIVAWKGGILGTSYKTTVVWKCSGSQHLGATVTEDNAQIAVAQDNARQLDDYFRTGVYAPLIQNVGAK